MRHTISVTDARTFDRAREIVKGMRLIGADPITVVAINDWQTQRGDIVFCGFGSGCPIDLDDLRRARRWARADVDGELMFIRPDQMATARHRGFFRIEATD